jgi:hypothetical protein
LKLRLALQSLRAQPVRSLVLACGFGSGIAAMAGLLGIGQVILEQSRSPALEGGGDAVVVGVTGQVPSARFLLSSILAAPPFEGRVTAASPAATARLYLVGADGAVTPVLARGGIPSLERSIGDPETSATAAWQDAPADRAWAQPDPADVLRAMDRFHRIPEVPARAGSFAEWLYFNGDADGHRFYLTFFVGPRTAPDRRAAGVRLQLDRGGERASYVENAEISESSLLRDAPDLAIGGNRVRLEGLRYSIELNLLAEATRSANRRRGAGPADLVGRIVLEAVPGHSIPPLEIRGAGGWLSGYVVPVLAGDLAGELHVRGERLSLAGGRGYHDHNWGFWEGVTWQWGQVAGAGLSFVYGRIRPPADAADPDRVPGLFVVLGQDGPIAYTTDLTIDETDDPAAGRPRSIRVRGRGESLSIEMELTVEDATRSSLGGPFAGEGGGIDFWQLRALYEVTGRVGEREVRITTPGTAETFRGQSAELPVY